MTLVRRDYWPSDPFREMDRLFSRAFGDSELWPGTLAATMGRDFPLDVYGDDERYFVVAELPGARRDEVDVRVENTVLTITLKREEKDSGEDARMTELSRSVTIGDDIEVEKVGAKLENGLLTVTLPKATGRIPRRIAVG